MRSKQNPEDKIITIVVSDTNDNLYNLLLAI